MEVLVASNHYFDKKDDANAVRLGELAREIDPTIAWTALWSKTVIKRAVGWAWCQRLSRAKGALRCIAAAEPRGTESSGASAGALRRASPLPPSAAGLIQNDVP
jgi:hypothetical protein